MIALASNGRVPVFQFGPEERTTPALRGDFVHEHLVQCNHRPRHRKNVDEVSGKWCGFCFAKYDNPGKVDAS